MIVKTSMFKMNVKSYDKLYKLLQEYYQKCNVSTDEFIETKLVTPNSSSLTEGEIEMFILIMRHNNFLNIVKNKFVEHYKLRHYNNVRIIMVIFVILFAPNQMDAEELFELFRNVKCAFKNKLLQYFWDENNLKQVALAGCKFFEDEYVINQIINPVLNRAEIFKKVDEYLCKEKLERRMPKLPTIPEHTTLYQRKKSVPPVPLNTPAEKIFQAQRVPKALYIPDKVEKKLIGEFERNKRKAQRLLAEAKALEKNYCKPKKSVVSVEVPRKNFKAKKAPSVKKPVEIKGNVATVLREASRCAKEQEDEIKQIEAVIEGGATLDKYKELEENDRKIEQQKSLEHIEKKHLEGLLTFEEAILAKKKLIECNKERFKEFMEEREKFLEQIENWRVEEQERMKELVKKGQEIERNAKQSEKRLKEEKKNKASLFKDEKRKLLQQAYEKQKEELAKKVKLIEEIKTLHQLRSLNSVKEFDPTECPNLGLLCQMSISELQEKLTEVKIKMEQQVEQKRKCIQKYKEGKRKMIENVKNFITQTRMSKPKRTVVPIRPTKLAHSPELDKLRSQLKNAREQRKNNLKLDHSPCVYNQKYKVFGKYLEI